MSAPVSEIESQTAQEIPAVAVQDPRLAWNEEVGYSFINGPNTILSQRVSTASQSTSVVQFSTNLSSNTGVVAVPIVEYDVTMQFSGQSSVAIGAANIDDQARINSQALVQLGRQDAPRFMPVMSCASAVTLTLEGSVFTEQLSNFLDPTFRYEIEDLDVAHSASLFRGAQDFYAQYADSSRTGTTSFGIGGEFQSPLSSLGLGVCPRAIGCRITQVSATQDTTSANAGNAIAIGAQVYVTVAFKSFEPLISPFSWKNPKFQRSLLGINNMAVTITLANHHRAWSSAQREVTPAAGQNARAAGCPLYVPGSFTFSSNPILHYQTLGANLLEPIPKRQLIPWQEKKYYASSLKTLQPVNMQSGEGAEETIESNTISCNGVPDYILIWVGKPVTTNVEASVDPSANPVGADVDVTMYQPDTYARIEKLTIQFGNSTLYQNTSEFELWQLSQQNGCNISWPAWRYTTGAVIKIRSNDLNLNALQAGGVGGAVYNLNITAQCKSLQMPNQTSGGNEYCPGIPTYQVSLQTLIVKDGIFSLSPGSSSMEVNPVPLSALIEAQEDGPIIHMSLEEAQERSRIRGSGFFDFIKNVGKTVAGPLLDMGLGFVKNKLTGGTAIGGNRMKLQTLGDRIDESIGARLGRRQGLLDRMDESLAMQGKGLISTTPAISKKKGGAVTPKDYLKMLKKKR